MNPHDATPVDMPPRARRYLFGIAALGLATLAVVLYPRVARCIAYHRVVTLGAASRNLAPQPGPVTIACAEKSAALSVGYAEMALPDGWATAIKVTGTTVSIFSEEGSAVVLLAPFFDSDLSPDGNYTWELSAAHCERQSLRAVFAMSAAEYDALIFRTIRKALDNYNQNGIGLFETQHVRGIIRYGPAADPGGVNVQVWSRHGQLSQGILVHASEAAAASRLVQCVLSHLTYPVDRVPPADALGAAIRSGLESHELFVGNPASAESVGAGRGTDTSHLPVVP